MNKDKVLRSSIEPTTFIARSHKACYSVSRICGCLSITRPLTSQSPASAEYALSLRFFWHAAREEQHRLLVGAIHIQPLSMLAQELARIGQLRDFVETGTFTGNSLEWASNHFERVWTIEIDEKYQARARTQHQSRTNIHFLLGDSAVELPKVCAELKGPAMIWLDAHAGAGFFAPEDNCPLLAELETIISSPFEHCIFIDDARAFVAPPPPPFNYKKWPALEEIFALLLRRPDYHTIIITDTLITVPNCFRDTVAKFCFAIRPKI